MNVELSATDHDPVERIERIGTIVGADLLILEESDPLDITIRGVEPWRAKYERGAVDTVREADIESVVIGEILGLLAANGYQFSVQSSFEAPVIVNITEYNSDYEHQEDIPYIPDQIRTRNEEHGHEVKDATAVDAGDTIRHPYKPDATVAVTDVAVGSSDVALALEKPGNEPLRANSLIQVEQDAEVMVLNNPD